MQCSRCKTQLPANPTTELSIRIETDQLGFRPRVDTMTGSLCRDCVHSLTFWMGNPTDASATVASIRELLYADGPDTEWEPDTIERVAELVPAYVTYKTVGYLDDGIPVKHFTDRAGAKPNAAVDALSSMLEPK